MGVRNAGLTRGTVLQDSGTLRPEDKFIPALERSRIVVYVEEATLRTVRLKRSVA